VRPPVPKTPFVPSATTSRGIVLFDGVCNLCNGTVQFILDRDPSSYFQFASLQSERGKALLAEHGIPPSEGDPDSVFLIEEGRIFDRSTAALRIARHLTFPWSLARVFLLVPSLLRDPFYKLIARNRYRWFGKTNECRIPTPELRARMLG
jgi:predicted DCC family thiol-disulfide oxidoreductase YuxK